MKVVINRCYGGFGLSPRATKRLAELNGRKCYFFVHPEGRSHIDLHKKIKATMAEADKAFVWFAYDVPNPDEILPSNENWAAMSMEQRRESNKQWSEHSIEHGRELVRHDSKLVQVVEELGKQASSKLADLAVVEIPDGVDYEIDEYDGIETIHEKHRSWS